MDPRRTCARPLCGHDASASMSYDYGARMVFVSTLTLDRHPAYYDLCVEHVTSLAPPRGWTTQGIAVPDAVGRRADVKGRVAAERRAVLDAAVLDAAVLDAKPPGSYSSFPPRNRPDAYLRRSV